MKPTASSKQDRSRARGTLARLRSFFVGDPRSGDDQIRSENPTNRASDLGATVTNDGSGNALTSELQFASHVAHEIRGPLTVMQGVVSDLLKSGEADHPHVQSLLVVSSQLELIKNLISKLLLLAVAGAGQLRASRRSVDLTKTLKDYCDEIEPIADGLKFTVNIQDNLTFEIDDDLFQSLIFNLITNAVKYNVADGWIEVRVWQDQECLNIKISNSTNEDLGACRAGFMNRFFRGPVARLGDSEGSGLGIHIAREIAAIHNGRLEFDFEKKNIFSVIFYAPR
ncbi:MAG: ATP-binding protein [Pseudomonadota bacterium]